MKSKFFLLGLCSLALASCSIDETTRVNDTNAISFKATTSTRAAAVTTNDINAFTVWAWEKVGDGTTEFMKGVQANKSGSVFITAPTYYWPGAALDFYAFIPAATVETDSSSDYDAYFGEYVSLAGDIIETANGVTYDSYEGYVANATITSSSAISFDMHVPADAAKEIDLGYAATLGQSTGTVGLNFRHALSQVAFKAMNGNADWNVDIKGVTLCCIYKEGTYTLPEFDEYGTTVHNASDAEKGEWTIKDGAVQGRFDAGIAETKLEGTTTSESITATNGALMLIPQTVAAWDPDTDPTNTALGAYIRINCQVIDTATGEQIWPNYHELDENTSEPLDYAEITVPFDVAWEEGNLYTYTIVFGEGLGYYAPDDENTDLDGTPVLIPIRFTVDIDDFGNTDDVDVSTETDGGYDPASLVLEYTIETDGRRIKLPLNTFDSEGDYTIDCTVDWGDGETESVSSYYPSHTYSKQGTYIVIINGTVEKLGGQEVDGRDCLTAVKQWGDTGLKSMQDAFEECSNLSSLPDGPGPFENVTTFETAFELCKSLKEVPEDLFKNCTAVTTFHYCFFSCTSLTTVPVSIFSSCTAVTDFYKTFYDCSSVVGESPYDEINVNGNTVKVHLYERENYPDYFTAPTTYGECFSACTKLDDYDAIPDSWK